MTDGEVKIKITADTSSFEAAMRNAEASVEKLKRAFAELEAMHARAFRRRMLIAGIVALVISAGVAWLCF